MRFGHSRLSGPLRACAAAFGAVGPSESSHGKVLGTQGESAWIWIPETSPHDDYTFAGA